jgi:hypothetical protein
MADKIAKVDASKITAGRVIDGLNASATPLREPYTTAEQRDALIADVPSFTARLGVYIQVQDTYGSGQLLRKFIKWVEEREAAGLPLDFQIVGKGAGFSVVAFSPAASCLIKGWLRCHNTQEVLPAAEASKST